MCSRALREHQFRYRTRLFILINPPFLPEMTLEYVGLRILEALARARRQLTMDQLQEESGRRGFPIPQASLRDGLRKLREAGLVDVLVLAGGETEEFAGVRITDRGERKIRSIVRL